MKPVTLVRSLALVTFLVSCPAFAREPVPDIDAALVEWKQAIESGSVDAIMKLYDKDAVMISTFVQYPMTRRADIAGYYKKVESNPDAHVEIEETHPRLFGNVAVNSGRYTLSYTQEGEEVAIPARFSFTYRLEGGKWMIVDQHSSRVPMAETK